ncbi:hypothetical protein LTR53_017041, partial [Teratosphaeriaceae sp. CCFEE 6253]
TLSMPPIPLAAGGSQTGSSASRKRRATSGLSHATNITKVDDPAVSSILEEHGILMSENSEPPANAMGLRAMLAKHRPSVSPPLYDAQKQWQRFYR